MFFGMFGSIFLLAQFLQVVQHYSPLQAGLRTLPWTGMPVLIAPVAGALSDRIGGRPLLATGLALQAIGLGWLAAVASPTVAYITMVPAFVIAGIGMSLFFAPVANVVLSSVRRDQEGIASGANNAIRELGGVFGIAVLGAVFSAHGSYASGTAFVSGLAPAVWVGGAAVAVASAAALFLPRMRKGVAGDSAAEPGPRTRNGALTLTESRARILALAAGSGPVALPLGHSTSTMWSRATPGSSTWGSLPAHGVQRGAVLGHQLTGRGFGGGLTRHPFGHQGPGQAVVAGCAAASRRGAVKVNLRCAPRRRPGAGPRPRRWAGPRRTRSST